MTAYSPADRAAAYANWGRWIADCPDGCGNAEKLDPGQDAYACSNCGKVALVSWPDDAARIWQALAVRVAPQHRNWFPAGHPLALAAGAPHGQRVEDLMAETFEHEGVVA